MVIQNNLSSSWIEALGYCFLLTPYYHLKKLKKILYSFSLMFNNLTKLIKNKGNRLCFSPVGVQEVWGFLVSMKNFWHCKKFLWDKFARKKEHFTKYFVISKILKHGYRWLVHCYTCREWMLYRKKNCKKDNRSSHQNIMKCHIFYCKHRSRFIFQHLMLKKSLRFITVYTWC